MSIVGSPARNSPASSGLFAAHLAKPSGEPWFILATGQSNSRGEYQVSEEPTTPNPNVFDFNETANGAGDWAFRVADIGRVSAMGGGYLTGLRGGDYGNTGWGFADTLQKLTGRDVYMVHVSQTGTPATDWHDGGAASNAIVAAFTPALAAVNARTGASMTKFDLVLWQQMETEIVSGTGPSEYATKLDTVITDGVSNGWIDDSVVWVACQPPHKYIHNNIFEAVYTTYAPTNNGKRKFVAVGSREFPEQDGDLHHFSGDSLVRLGRKAAEVFLKAAAGTLDSAVIPNKAETLVITESGGVSDGPAASLGMGIYGPSSVGGMFCADVDVMVRERDEGDTNYYFGSHKVFYQAKTPGTPAFVRLHSAAVTENSNGAFALSFADFAGLGFSVSLSTPNDQAYKWSIRVRGFSQVEIG